MLENFGQKFCPDDSNHLGFVSNVDFFISVLYHCYWLFISEINCWQRSQFLGTFEFFCSRNIFDVCSVLEFNLVLDNNMSM